MGKNKAVVLIKARGTSPEIIDVGETVTLDEIKKILGDITIDIVSRKIGGKMFDLIIDDEGLMKTDCVITGVTGDSAKEVLVGNILVTKTNADGETIGLSNKEILTVQENVTDFIKEGRFRNHVGGGDLQVIKGSNVLMYNI